MWIGLLTTSIKYKKEETTMSKRMIHLALVVSLAFIIGACASAPIDPAAKGKIGDPVAPRAPMCLEVTVTVARPEVLTPPRI